MPQILSVHNTLLLLKHPFALPKLLYNLRAAPVFSPRIAGVHDELLKSILSDITKIHFGEDDPACMDTSYMCLL